MWIAGTANLKADEINFLVYRYLQENGYTHSAFIFSVESQVHESKIDSSQVPPGVLLSFIKRGVNFMEVEEQLQGYNTDVLRDSSARTGFVSLLELHRYLCDPIGNAHKWRRPNPQIMEAVINEDFEENDVLKLPGHTNMVYAVQWNPMCSILASIAGDRTARIWKIPEDFSVRGTQAAESAVEFAVLNHASQREPSTSGEAEAAFASLAWNNTGTLLGTGSNEGEIRLWNTRAEQQSCYALHKGPVFVLKWNPGGTHFVSGSTDHTVAIWSGDTGKCFKHYPFHNGVVLDVDWKNNELFASCSTDKTILLCSLNSNFPLLKFTGHEDDINMVRFSPFRSMLGSASDDHVAGIWCYKSSRLIQPLTGHQKEVYALDWCPTEERGLILATGSFDMTVKLWDVNKGLCLDTFEEHNTSIFDLKYSNDGQFLASASADGTMIIWSARDCTVLRKFKGHSPIHELAWNHLDDKVSAVHEDGSVIVFDVRKLKRFR